eukprot:tig00000402_g182.t1
MSHPAVFGRDVVESLSSPGAGPASPASAHTPRSAAAGLSSMRWERQSVGGGSAGAGAGAGAASAAAAAAATAAELATTTDTPTPTTPTPGALGLVPVDAVMLTEADLALRRAMSNLDDWFEFDIWRVAELTGGRPLVRSSFSLHQKHSNSPSHIAPLLRSPQVPVTLAVVERHGLVHRFGLDALRLSSFLRTVEAHYLDNPYHSAIHAADVVQSLHFLLLRGGLASRLLSDLEVLAAILAAVVHDLGHGGFTNAFEIATSSERALVYNDRSPLENYQNYHVSKASMLLRKPELDFLAGLTPEERREVRPATRLPARHRWAASRAPGWLLGWLGAAPPPPPPLLLLFLGRLEGAATEERPERAAGRLLTSGRLWPIRCLRSAPPAPPPRSPTPGRGQVRKATIGMVLSTDLAVHFELMGQFKARAGQEEFGAAPEEKALALNLAIKVRPI